MAKSKARHKGRPGKTKTEYLLRQHISTLTKINAGLTAAKTALDNEVAEVLEEVVHLGENQQDQLNEINKRLDRLEGKENAEEAGDTGDKETVEKVQEKCEDTRVPVSEKEQP